MKMHKSRSSKTARTETKIYMSDKMVKFASNIISLLPTNLVKIPEAKRNDVIESQMM